MRFHRLQRIRKSSRVLAVALVLWAGGFSCLSCVALCIGGGCAESVQACASPTVAHVEPQCDAESSDSCCSSSDHVEETESTRCATESSATDESGLESLGGAVISAGDDSCSMCCPPTVDTKVLPSTWTEKTVQAGTSDKAVEVLSGSRIHFPRVFPVEHVPDRERTYLLCCVFLI